GARPSARSLRFEMLDVRQRIRNLLSARVFLAVARNDAIVYGAPACDHRRGQCREQREQFVAGGERGGTASSRLRAEIALSLTIDLCRRVHKAGKIAAVENGHGSLLSSVVVEPAALVRAESTNEIDVVAEYAQQRLPGIGTQAVRRLVVRRRIH